MPASDEFPRGVTLTSSPGLGNACSITLPGCPGICWVVTDIYFGIYNASTASGYGSGITITPTGFINVIGGGVLAVPFNSSTGGDYGDWTYSGKPVTFPSNTNVTFSVQQVSYVEPLLIVSAYAI